MGLIVAVLLATAIAGAVVRRRRAAAMRDHAVEQGWHPVEDSAGFAQLVVDTVPEVRQQAEQDARASRRAGGRRGGPGLTVSLGRSPSTRSRARGRNVYLVSSERGETAVSDVTVTARAGTLSQGRATVRRGAVAARLADQVPALKLTSRSWLDRDGQEAMPADLSKKFSDETLDSTAKQVYLDSDAWRPLLEVADDVDAVVVDGATLVLLSPKGLHPQRASALVTAAEQLVTAATRAGAGDSGSWTRLVNPLARR